MRLSRSSAPARFIGFALDPSDRLETYLKANPFNHGIVPDSEPIARSFGVDSWPSHMIGDRAGNIAWIAATDADGIEPLPAMLFGVLVKRQGRQLTALPGLTFTFRTAPLHVIKRIEEFSKLGKP